MIKLLLFMLGVVGAAQIAHAAVEPLQIALFTKSNLAVERFDRLKITAGHVIYNLNELSPNILPAIATEIRTLAHPRTVVGSNCSAGFYTLDVEFKGQKSVERGCLETNRAHDLVASFHRVEETARLAHVIHKPKSKKSKR